MELKTKIGIGLAAIFSFIVLMIGIQVLYSPPAPQTTPAKNVSQLNETFNKSDFIYGPQAWKPYLTKTLPIVEGNDPNGNDSFYVMFVDLYATPFGIDTLSNYTGGIKVDYNFTGLTGLAAFNVYGFAMHSNALGNIPGIYLTNRVSDPATPGDSGYYVHGDSTLTGSTPSTKSLGMDLDHITVANSAGPAFNVYNNSTYAITFIQAGGGLNALHITTDAGSNKREDFGQVTYTNNQSGTFYVSDTGGAGISDVVLMVAVNGTIPNSFALHLDSSMVNRSVFE
jgi:hypothetical protein